jgi:hypothetical protein
LTSQPRIAFTTIVPVQSSASRNLDSQIIHSTASKPTIQFTMMATQSVGVENASTIHVQQPKVVVDQQVLQRDAEQNATLLISSSDVGQKDDGLSTDGLKEFEDMIDEMVYKVWECGCCLSMCHKASVCVNDIRCRACFSYGHIAKKCLHMHNKKSHIWVPKKFNAKDSPISQTNPTLSFSAGSTPPRPNQSAPTSVLSPPSPSHPPTAPPSMAVFELDPTPWLPLGHQILDGGPTRLPRTYCTPAVAPPRRHNNYYMDLQSSLFGVGLLEMRSAATRQILVQHPMRQIEEGFFC